MAAAAAQEPVVSPPPSPSPPGSRLWHVPPPCPTPSGLQAAQMPPGLQAALEAMTRAALRCNLCGGGRCTSAHDMAAHMQSARHRDRLRRATVEEILQVGRERGEGGGERGLGVQQVAASVLSQHARCACARSCKAACARERWGMSVCMRVCVCG